MNDICIAIKKETPTTCRTSPLVLPQQQLQSTQLLDDAGRPLQPKILDGEWCLMMLNSLCSHPCSIIFYPCRQKFRRFPQFDLPEAFVSHPTLATRWQRKRHHAALFCDVGTRNDADVGRVYQSIIENRDRNKSVCLSVCMYACMHVYIYIYNDS